MKRNLEAIASAIGATLYQPEDYLCDEHRCPTLDSDGVPYFRDLGHYRAAAVRTDRFRASSTRRVGLNKQYGAAGRRRPSDQPAWNRPTFKSFASSMRAPSASGRAVAMPSESLVLNTRLRSTP